MQKPPAGKGIKKIKIGCFKRNNVDVKNITAFEAWCMSG